MATVSAQGTTFSLPNYHGELFVVTPTETPFLSAIGGLGGAKMTTATQFEWQTVDRRASNPNNVALEGAAAPTAQERSRANVDNVVEIHQSAIEISYSRLAATGNFAGANIAAQSDDAVLNELAFQTSAELESMAVDIEKSFLNGYYQKPADNTTARKTQGILTVINTNRVDIGASIGSGTCTIVASTATFTSSAVHGLSIGDKVDISAFVTTTGALPGRFYVFSVPTTTTFTLSSTPGGSILVLTNDGSATGVTKPSALSKANIDTLFTTAFDNGAKLPEASTVIMVGSAQKVALSNVYSVPALNQPTFTRNIGGINMSTIVTDFGTFGIMLDRWMPAGQIAVLDLSVCYPVFLNIPDKGLLFTEELARVGSSRKFQLYGEVGLEYGPETYHAVLTSAA